MRGLTKAEKERFWEEVRKEFPEDKMMQQIHYVRLLHHHQTKGLSRREFVEFFEDPENKLHAQPLIGKGKKSE